MLFGFGDEALCMYFVVSGELVYTMANGTELDPPISTPDWCSEQALWISWRHCGELRASSESELVSVDAEGFCTVMSSNFSAWQLGAEYAKLFTAHLAAR